MLIETRACDMPVHNMVDDEAQTRTFSLDGRDYEIDLCLVHDLPFMNMVDKWAQAARSAGRRQAAPGRPRRTAAGRRRTSAIREWARGRGYIIGDNGRLPVQIVAEYDEAHGS